MLIQTLAVQNKQPARLPRFLGMPNPVNIQSAATASLLRSCKRSYYLLRLKPCNTASNPVLYSLIGMIHTAMHLSISRCFKQRLVLRKPLTGVSVGELALRIHDSWDAAVQSPAPEEVLDPTVAAANQRPTCTKAPSRDLPAKRVCKRYGSVTGGGTPTWNSTRDGPEFWWRCDAAMGLLRHVYGPFARPNIMKGRSLVPTQSCSPLSCRVLYCTIIGTSRCETNLPEAQVVQAQIMISPPPTPAHV